ncbi:DNA-directed RNA polymerase subunit alpha [Patescibacteria group bacterium]
MENILLPNSTNITEDEKNTATITIEPLYPGYGTTVGNALRRVMLSSLPGAAVTSVKIIGVDHEFSTIDFVKEDVVEIILNLKKLNFKLKGDEAVKANLKISSVKKVTGKEIKLPTQATLINTDQHIATVTDAKSKLEMELTIENGRGYVPIETRDKEKQEIGNIAIDAIYTPVRNVNFENEHVRVGQFTNYDRLKLQVKTDGTITPTEALSQATNLLIDHFKAIEENSKSKNDTKGKKDTVKKPEVKNVEQ